MKGQLLNRSRFIAKNDVETSRYSNFDPKLVKHISWNTISWYNSMTINKALYTTYMFLVRYKAFLFVRSMLLKGISNKSID